MSAKSFARMWMPVARLAAERLSRDDEEVSDRIVAAILSGLESYSHGTRDVVKLVVAIRGGAATGQRDRQVSLPSIPMSGAFADLEDEEGDSEILENYEMAESIDAPELGALDLTRQELDSVDRKIYGCRIILAADPDDGGTLAEWARLVEREVEICGALWDYYVELDTEPNHKVLAEVPDDRYIFANPKATEFDKERLGAVPYAYLDGEELCGEHEGPMADDDIAQHNKANVSKWAFVKPEPGSLPVSEWYELGDDNGPKMLKSWIRYDLEDVRLPVERIPRNAFKALRNAWYGPHEADKIREIADATVPDRPILERHADVMGNRPTSAIKEHDAEIELAWMLRYLGSHLAKTKGIEPADFYEKAVLALDLSWDIEQMSLESEDFGENVASASDGGDAELARILFPEEADFEEELPDMEWKGHKLETLLRHIGTTGPMPWQHKVWLRAQVDSLARGYSYDEAAAAAKAAFKAEQRRVVPTTIVAIVGHGLKTSNGKVLDWDTAQSHTPWLRVKGGRDKELAAKCKELGTHARFFGEAFEATLKYFAEHPRQ